MPSLYEGGPYTVLEAMAMAKPVVATPVGLVPDVVYDVSTGLLVPPADGATLARAVLRLLDNPELARGLGERGYALVASRFSLERMLDDIVEVYQAVA
jgi:glycosyltransferase involved in cell wall biosynthesis